MDAYQRIHLQRQQSFRIRPGRRDSTALGRAPPGEILPLPVKRKKPIYSGILIVLLFAVMLSIILKSDCETFEKCLVYTIEVSYGEGQSNLKYNDWLMYYFSTETNAIAMRQYWRLISSIFITSSAKLLAVHITELIALGIQLEQEFGGLILVLFFSSGIFGNAISAIGGFQKYVCGATPSLAGLNGAAFAELCFNGKLNKVTTFVMLVLGVALTAANGMIEQLDWVMELCCFWYGFFLTILYRVESHKAEHVSWIGCGIEVKLKRCTVHIVAVAFLMFTTGFCCGAMKMMEPIMPANLSPSP